MEKLIIADDHAILREGLKKILAHAGGYTIVGEVGSAIDLINILSSTQAKILLLDLSMPGAVGVELLKEINKKYPKLLVLVLTFHSEVDYGLRVFKAGAIGFLNKSCATEQLILALQSIVEGKRYFSKETMDTIFNQLEKKTASNLLHYDLSDRELHVFTMIGQGITLTQISIDLSLSVKTVSTYRLRVLKKMNMTTNAQIVRYFITHGDSHEALAK